MRPLTSLAFRFAMFAALGGGAVTACNSSDAAKPADAGYGEQLDFCGLPKSCQEIVLACHDKDEAKIPKVHECHETAHETGTDSACKPIHNECIAACNAAPEIVGGIHEQFGPCEGGAGAHDASTHD